MYVEKTLRVDITLKRILDLRCVYFFETPNCGQEMLVFVSKPGVVVIELRGCELGSHQIFFATFVL